MSVSWNAPLPHEWYTALTTRPGTALVVRGLAGVGKSTWLRRVLFDRGSPSTLVELCDDDVAAGGGGASQRRGPLQQLHVNVLRALDALRASGASASPPRLLWFRDADVSLAPALNLAANCSARDACVRGLERVHALLEYARTCNVVCVFEVCEHAAMPNGTRMLLVSALPKDVPWCRDRVFHAHFDVRARPTAELRALLVAQNNAAASTIDAVCAAHPAVAQCGDVRQLSILAQLWARSPLLTRTTKSSSSSSSMSCFDRAALLLNVVVQQQWRRNGTNVRSLPPLRQGDACRWLGHTRTLVDDTVQRIFVAHYMRAYAASLDCVAHTSDALALADTLRHTSSEFDLFARLGVLAPGLHCARRLSPANEQRTVVPATFFSGPLDGKEYMTTAHTPSLYWLDAPTDRHRATDAPQLTCETMFGSSSGGVRPLFKRRARAPTAPWRVTTTTTKRKAPTTVAAVRRTTKKPFASSSLSQQTSLLTFFASNKQQQQQKKA